MKLPITDEFLWKLYGFVEASDRAYDVIAPRTMRQALSPELFRLKREYERRGIRKAFGQFIYYLKRKGYIQISRAGLKRGVIFTPKGRAKALRVKWMMREKKKRPDGKWLMIIFDIPEVKKKLREILRDALLSLGYQKLQQSVWISPYDVYNETEEIIQEYALDRWVRLFLIEEQIT